jgi:predicted transcriptional regulator of viral defense system
MHNAYKNSYLEADVTRKVQSKLKRALPNLRVISSEIKAGPASRFDLYAKDASGKEYFIEVKARRCHRVDIGQIVEQAAIVLKERPTANILLICSSIEPAVKDVLSKAGIKTLVFTELRLEAPAADHELKEAQLDMSPTEQQAYFALVRNERKVISTKDFASLFDIPVKRAKNLLVALSKHGVIFRFGKGKYAVLPPDVLYERKSYTADPYVLVDAVMHGQDYYVAYNSAAHLHGIATQLPFTTFVATVKQRRPINLGKVKIRFVTIKKSRFFGTEEREYFGSPLHVSDLEKTIVDCLDRSDLVGGMDEAARIVAEALDKLDLDKLADYAKMMDKKVLIQRLGFTLEKLSDAGYRVPQAILDQLDRMVDQKYAYALDPKVRKKGKLSRRWRIDENVNCLRWHYA